MKINIKELVTTTKYSLTSNLDDNVCVTFSIWHVLDVWKVGTENFGWQSPFKIMGNETFGGDFSSLEAAETELIRAIQFYRTPLTDTEIKTYFNEEWISGEEEYDKLKDFRKALLGKCWKVADTILNKKFSTWTWEAIPDKVKYQISLQLGKV
jgi:hypothetical protein